MSNDPITCAMFDDEVDELALGLVAEPHRSDLVAHAARCPRCQGALDALVPVVDRLLLLSPEIEPPAGFENRALARLGMSPAGAATHRRRLRWFAAAAAVVLLIGAGVAVRAAIDSHGTSTSAPVGVMSTGAMVTGNGAYLGTVQLIESPAPHVLIAVPKPRGGSGLRTCELQRADGTWVAVGSWDVADIASGVWATGIDASLLNAQAMRITLDDGTVVATASLS